MEPDVTSPKYSCRTSSSVRINAKTNKGSTSSNLLVRLVLRNVWRRTLSLCRANHSQRSVLDMTTCRRASRRINDQDRIYSLLIVFSCMFQSIIEDVDMLQYPRGGIMPERGLNKWPSTHFKVSHCVFAFHRPTPFDQG